MKSSISRLLGLLLFIAAPLEQTYGGIFDDPDLVATQAEADAAAAAPASQPAMGTQSAVAEDIEAAPGRLPVPNPEAQADAEKLLHEVFSEDYANSAPAARAALAKKLLQQALQASVHNAEHFILLQEAKDIAAAVGDVDTATVALEELEQTYDVNADPMWLALFQSAARGASLPQAHEQVVNLGTKLVEDAVRADNYATAVKIAVATEVAATKSKNVVLIAEARARAKEVRELRDEYERLREAIRILDENPDDPDANLALGKFLCFRKGEWSAGLPLLAKGSDPTLAELAKQDAALPTDVGARMMLADGWWDLAAKHGAAARPQLIGRACLWYRLASPNLAGLDLAKAEKRLKEGESSAPFSQPRFKRTPTVGGGGGGAFEDVPQSARVMLVGFGVVTDNFYGGHTVISWLQPIYTDGRKKLLGGRFGAPEGKQFRVEAKNGYAVGGIVAKGGHRLDGFRITFMRVRGNRLDPNDRYESDWIGGRGGGGETTLGGNGKPVVGIFGRSGKDIDAMGLIQIE